MLREDRRQKIMSSDNHFNYHDVGFNYSPEIHRFSEVIYG